MLEHMFSPAQLRAAALEVAASLKPELLTGQQAAHAVRDLVVAEKAIAGLRMLLAARVAQTDAWRDGSHQSPADWHASQAGIAVGTSKAQLNAAKAADRLPKTQAAMRKGKLSADQATAVADAAALDPSSEQKLLDKAANDTNANLKKEAANVKAAATDSATREKRSRAQRFLRQFTDADGGWNLHVRGSAADGVAFEALFRRYRERRFRHASKTGERDTFENRSYDAFIDMLRDIVPPTSGVSANAAAAGANADAGADAPPTADADEPTAHTGIPSTGPRPEPTPPTGTGTSTAAPTAASPPHDPPPTRAQEAVDSDTNPFAGRDGPTGRLPGGDNIKVIVRIDHTALARGHTVAGETCDVVGVGPISVETAKGLMHNAFLAAVILDGNDVVNVAHLGRGLNAYQRTAVEAIGLRCSNQKCNKTVALEIDHREPWTIKEETKLDNQDPLCPGCHRLKTHRGYRLEPGTGRRRLLGPDEAGSPHPADPPAPTPDDCDQPTLC
jgi:hypothetical protein